jgi:hypothetical protein
MISSSFEKLRASGISYPFVMSLSNHERAIPEIPGLFS